MPPTEHSDPRAAYAVQRALVDVRLEELRRALEAHEADRPPTWGHVRSLEQVEARLAETVAFISKKPPPDRCQN